MFSNSRVFSTPRRYLFITNYVAGNLRLTQLSEADDPMERLVALILNDTLEKVIVKYVPNLARSKKHVVRGACILDIPMGAMKDLD